MSMLSFLKDAGEKLFGKGAAQAQTPAVTPEQVKASNDAAGDAILGYINSQGLKATGLTVTFDGATFLGYADSLKGHVAGVAAVNDKMSVDQSAPQAQFYTVVRGDTLSKIAKQYYGDANKYPVIFEANKPMLKSPDLIYPGQMLRIPPQ